MKTLITLAATAALLFGQPSADVDLKVAMHKEEVQGDLKGAIDAYRKIAAKYKTNRAVAARATLHMARCHERLGQAEARRLYEEIARSFSDQPQVVAQARERLAAMTEPSNGGVRTRLVWDKAIDVWGTVTPDGRYLSFVDWSTGDLAIRDLQTGQNRRLTDRGGFAKAMGEAEASAISPDGAQIAYSWDRWDPKAEQEGYYELRLIGVDGKNDRLLHRVQGYLEPHSWSPDGKWIAAAVKDQRAGPTAVVLVSVADGTKRVLPTRTTQASAFKDKLTFSPDGKWIAFDSVELPGQPANLYVVKADGTLAAEVELAKDAKLMGWSPDGKTILFSRRRNQDSMLYLLPFTDGRAAGPEAAVRGVNTPGVPMGVTSRGTLFYANTNQQFDATLITRESSGGLKPALSFPVLPSNRTLLGATVKFSPDGSRFLVPVEPKAVLIRSVAGTEEFTVTPQMETARVVDWTHDGSALLIHGIGAGSRKGFYRVDLRSGAVTLLFEAASPQSGTIAFASSRDGKAIYYINSASALVVRDLETGRERILVDPHQHGLRELRMSRDGKSLAVRLGPVVNILDLATGQLRELYRRNVSTDNNVIQGIEWSPDDRHIVILFRDFVTKVTQLGEFPVAGGDPKRHMLPNQTLRGISISPNGTIATMRTESESQIWTVENFLPSK